MYRVVRTYTRSHTSKNLLWSVESRPFIDKQDADFWCEFCQNQWNEFSPRYPAKFFVVEVFTDQDDGRFT